MAIDFSLNELLGPQRCYLHLRDLLHPDGFGCPNGHPLAEAGVHKRHREPVLNYLCKSCGCHFNVFTDTILKGTHYSVVQLVQLLRGIAQGAPTARVAREIEADRGCLLDWRHKMQELANQARPHTPLPDSSVEADEMYQNAGEKGEPHMDPQDPPRRRANKKRGHGTWDNDRPPVLGIVGRQSKQARFEVCHHSTRNELEPHVLSATTPGTVVNTDEWGAYARLPKAGRPHASVGHGPDANPRWARDDDGDGVREVHCNTIEGIWTGLRNFLRPFRGVHKKYLQQYVAVFEWAHNLKAVSLDYLRALLGVRTT